MANYQELDKVLDLIAKTGDKAIVVSDQHKPYVIMSIGEYQGLLHSVSSVKGLTEDELLDKINRDIAVWKASQDNLPGYDLEQFQVDLSKKDNKLPEKEPVKETVVTPIEDEDAKYYIEPVD